MGESIWVIKVTEKLKGIAEASTDVERFSKRSIYELPDAVRNLEKNAFDPHLASFGPYHYGKKHLKPMEEHKERALQHFLKRSNKPLISLISDLADVVQELKDSYHPLDQEWQNNNDKFLELMIMDGCFMVEILLSTTENGFDGYDQNDLIFSAHGKLYVMPHIGRDMLLLENQLPMLLVEQLLAFSGFKDKSINELVISFFPHEQSEQVPKKCVHILDVFRKSKFHKPSNEKAVSLPDHEKDVSPPTAGKFKSWLLERSPMAKLPCCQAPRKIMRCVSELHEAGIHFKKSSTRSLLDISFDKERGTLCLSPITVDDTTESTFQNLLAFERLHVGAGNSVSAYTFFMDKIIDTERDVHILSKKGYIENHIGSDKAVAEMFNSLAKGITPDPNEDLVKIPKTMVDYCRNPRNRVIEWKAIFWRTHFRSPWTCIGLLAAFILFTLQVTQTTYSILDYHRETPSPTPNPPTPFRHS